MNFTIKTLTDAGAALLAHGDAEKKVSIIDSIIVSNSEPSSETTYADLTFSDFGQYKEFPIVNMREKDNTFIPEAIASNDGITNNYQINMVGLKGHTDGEDNPTLIAVAIDTSNSPLVLPAQTSVPYKLYLDFPVAYSNSSNVQVNVSNAGMVDFDNVNSMVSVAFSSASANAKSLADSAYSHASTDLSSYANNNDLKSSVAANTSNIASNTVALSSAVTTVNTELDVKANKDYVDNQTALQFDNSVKVADSYTDNRIGNFLALFGNNVPVPVSASGTQYGSGQWNGVAAFYAPATNVITLHGFANPQTTNDYLTLDVSNISNYLNSPIDIVSCYFNSMTQLQYQPQHVYSNAIIIKFGATGVASFEGVTIQLGKVSTPAVKPTVPSFAPSDTQIIDYPLDASRILSETHYFVNSTKDATNVPSDLMSTSPDGFLIYYGYGCGNSYITENIQTVNADGTIGSKKYHRYAGAGYGFNSNPSESSWSDWSDGFDPYYHL